MTVDKEGRTTSPVHVHIDDALPVHVHLKKPKKPVSIKVEGKLTSDTKDKKCGVFGSSNLRRSGASVQARSKSPGRSPWVPPPAKSSAGHKLSWQGPSHRLEVTPDDARAVQHTLDVDTDEEDKVHHRMRHYEKTIDSLMNEVGTLKNEVELQRSQQELEQQAAQLDSSRRELEDQHDELNEFRRELEATEVENRILRRSMDWLQEDANLSKSERERLNEEKDVLMKKLVEVEVDGQAAAKQLGALRDMIRRLREKSSPQKKEDQNASEEKVVGAENTDKAWMENPLHVTNDVSLHAIKENKTHKRDFTTQTSSINISTSEEKWVSSADAAMLSKQRELLMERLADFEETNRALRTMLRERHEEEASVHRLTEQRDILLRKLADTEHRVQTLRAENLEKERQLVDTAMQADAQKEENVAMSSLHTSLESTRAHLQKQLRQKEADCNRMAVQIRSLESQLAQERIEVDHLQQLLNQAKEKAVRDKEALKKATRVQKQRATKSEDALEQLSAQLLEKEQQAAELAAECDTLRSFLDKTNKEKSQHLAENSALKTRVSELEAVMERLENDSKSRVDHTNSLLHEKSAETGQYRLENDRIKVSLGMTEDKLAACEKEMGQLRSNLHQYEALVEEYRSQMNKSRREADETMMQLEDQKRETSRVALEGENQLEKVKARLQTRLQELEPIPELLQTTELKLQDASEKVLMYEKKNMESTKLIAELTAKLERQNDQMDSYHNKISHSEDKKRSLEATLESLERKLCDIEQQNRELMTSNAKREEALHQANLHADEKAHETATLQRQLETALTEARRHTEQSRDKAQCKERSIAARVNDLEAQISAARTENARLKREKDEAERRFNSRLYDLKDRLDQSHSTNRSLQNYVQFLKSSYANVFGDASFTSSSPIRGAGPAAGFS